MSLSLSSLSLTTTSSSSEKMSSVLSSKSYLQQSDSFLYRKGTNNNAAASTTLQNVTAAAAAAGGGGQCYRATSLWLRTVGLFRSGVPLGRHRGAGLRGVWRSYENSFVASEAVTWMVGKMKEEGEEVSSQENVKSNVTRAKIVLLLDKFLHAGVFQHAAASGNAAASSSCGKLTSFKDDRAVYRLCEAAGDDDDDKENSSSSSVAAGGTTRGVYVTEIRCTPMSLDEVHALWESVFKARVVEVFGGGAADPMLLLSSGEAAAGGGSLLKRNSEESVKLNHHQQWGNNDEVLPPSWLTSAMSFLTHYPRWKLLSSSAGGGGGDTASSSAAAAAGGSFYPNMCGDVLRLVTEYFRSYSGIRDSSDSTTTTFFDLVSRVFQQQQDNNIQQGQPPPPPRRHTHHRGEKKRYYEEVWVGAMSESTDALLTGLLLSPNDTAATAAEELYYATEFLGVGSPLTRVLSERDIRAGAGGGGGGYFNACLTLSPADLINHPKYEGVRRRLFRQHTTTSSSRSLTDLTNISNHGGMMSPLPPLPPTSFLDDNSCSSSSSPSPSLRVVGLRLLLLQLPWGVRRHLYVLLRFMDGVSRNKLLQLDVAATNKDIMLSTFVDVVFPTTTTATTTTTLVDPYESLYREQLVCYLMDNVEGLFSADEDLLNSVKAQMQERQVQRVKVWRPLREEEGGDVYCAKVSAEEYDAQAYAMRNASLRDLLDAYCQKEDSKHTRKMVKKFREEYPHIYAEKFGPPASASGGKKNRVVAATATAAATAESSQQQDDNASNKTGSGGQLLQRGGGGRRRRVLGVL